MTVSLHSFTAAPLIRTPELRYAPQTAHLDTVPLSPVHQIAKPLLTTSARQPGRTDHQSFTSPTLEATLRAAERLYTQQVCLFDLQPHPLDSSCSPIKLRELSQANTTNLLPFAGPTCYVHGCQLRTAEQRLTCYSPSCHTWARAVLQLFRKY